MSFSQMCVFTGAHKSPAVTDAKAKWLQMCEISPIWFSNRLLEQMQSHISCMWAIFWNVSFHTSPQIAYLNRCKFTLVACVWFSQMWVFTCAHVLSNRLLEQMQSHISCMWAIFLNVNFHMSPQIAYLTRCKFTFVACVWFSQIWVFTFALK